MRSRTTVLMALAGLSALLLLSARQTNDRPPDIPEDEWVALGPNCGIWLIETKDPPMPRWSRPNLEGLPPEQREEEEKRSEEHERRMRETVRPNIGTATGVLLVKNGPWWLRVRMPARSASPEFVTHM
jgi:hypothetical protein